MTTATAGMPLPILLDKLARTGWPGLERRHAVVLRALCARLPHRSAEGTATAPQLADAAHYSSRWVRETLTELEDLDVIVWHRGGVRAGKPMPSTFRVVKARLVELLHQGAAAFADMILARRAVTAARVAGLAACFGHRRRPHHAEATATPTPKREVTAGAAAPAPSPPGTGAPPPGLTSDLRSLLRRQRRFFEPA